MTILIALITALMYYLDAHPAAITIGLVSTAWALTLDTRALLKNRNA